MRVSKKVLGLAGLAIVLVAIAILLVVQSGIFSERALPALATQLDQIARITIRHKAETLGLRKADDGTWHVETAGDAPARDGMVDQLLDDLTGMIVAEKKSAPASARLDGSQAYAFTLADKGGVGLALFAIRHDDSLPEDQALIIPEGGKPVVAARVPEIDLSPEHWAEVFLPTVKAERVRVLRVMTPDGRMSTFERSAPNAAFQRVAADAGAPVNAEAVRQAVEAVETLKYDQVQQARDLAWTGATMVMAETFDGVTLTLLCKADDTGAWVRVNAHHQATPGEAPEAAGPAEEEAARLNRMRAFAFRLPRETAARLLGAVGS
ncbi:hypothetical protein [Pedomonas mirosovicensis]|uniref:hypothetical protein n=1 Tax=Pedomonas mirosovicensis TaxID=2908641 RepID=UPI002167D9AF|nr:hypothetical protein [Pedomonas mirosovicensis]MCH8683792.1 hypothetical protein [Pedomonas mirosovicensis]